MNQEGKVRGLRRPVKFTIDGEEHETADRRQPAADLLRLAGLDPALYDLGELRPGHAGPTRYLDDEVVTVRSRARFVSIRQCADVA